MSRVKNKNTKPEVQVRSMLHRMGYRFRLHSPELPGEPDVVLPKYHKVIFVHGCFWHSHNCPRGKRPSSRTEFWSAKLSANVERDRMNREALIKRGWQVLIVWECELNDENSVSKKLRCFIESEPNTN